jgi:hypothetical protein
VIPSDQLKQNPVMNAREKLAMLKAWAAKLDETIVVPTLRIIF